MGNVGAIARTVLIIVSGFLLFQWFGKPKGADTAPSITQPKVTLPDSRAQYQFCEITRPEFNAQFTTRGATLKHFHLLAEKYKSGKLSDLSTTPQPGTTPNTPEENDPKAGSGYSPGSVHEFRQQLFTQFKNATSPGAAGATDWATTYDSVDWTLKRSTENLCEFVYNDGKVELTKLIETTERPYELVVKSRIKNLGATAKNYAFAIDTVDWWLDKEVENKMFRVSPYITAVECIGEAGVAHRFHHDHFEPSHFTDPEFSATGEFRWFQAPEAPAFASISNAYFGHALVPLSGPNAPVCQLQVEPRRQSGVASGAFYRARLAYPSSQLPPGETAEYSVLSYVGPKEREILSKTGGKPGGLAELIDLGFFSSIAKILVAFLLKVHGLFGNWGLAIIILTVCARTLLFPLALPGIKTMIKMRELKPEMDVINEKYKDDMRAKGVAQMELWRKHGMSPFDQVKGCLPQLATMPVWFALYSTLQTAVELYNIPFLWFPDLSQPDPYFILPFVIGATYFAQQKITPFQGDPAQRKMMLYFMPAMFTVFMLFLPAGLGVYMFTNSLLAILQQQLVESHAKSSLNRTRLSISEERPSSAQGTLSKKSSGAPSVPPQLSNKDKKSS